MGTGGATQGPSRHPTGTSNSAWTLELKLFQNFVKAGEVEDVTKTGREDAEQEVRPKLSTPAPAWTTGIELFGTTEGPVACSPMVKVFPLGEG